MTHETAGSAPRTLALLVAPQRRAGLHELMEVDCAAALPFAHGLRVIDFQLANLRRAGVDEVIVLQPGTAQSGLREHVRAVWAPLFRRIACLGGPAAPEGPDINALHRFVALIEGVNPDELLVLPADHICEPDLAGMIAFHRSQHNLLTLGAHADADGSGSGAVDAWITALNRGNRAGIGLMILDWHWLRGCLGRITRIDNDLPQQLIMAASREAGLQLWNADAPGSYWRRLDSLDTFRVTWLDFAAGSAPPCKLPLASAAGRPAASPQRANVRDSVIMPGASVSDRASVLRAIIAPGAHVPDGMVIGQDPEFDSRMFRRTRGGTTLVTPRMLVAASAVATRARRRAPA